MSGKLDLADVLKVAARRDGPPDAAKERVSEKLRVADVAEAAAAQVLAERDIPSIGRHGKDAVERRRTREWIGALAVAACVLALGFGGFVNHENKQHEAAQAASQAQQDQLQKQMDALNAQLAEQSQQIEAAQAALANAKDDSARMAAQAQLAAAQNALKSTSASISHVARNSALGGAPAPSAKAAACTCNKMDPLCGCIQ